MPDAEKGLVLVAIGAVLAGVGSLMRTDPRDGLVAWIATLFGAIYVGLLSFVLHVATSAPPVAGVRAAVRGGRRAGLGPAAGARRVELRHGRLPRRPARSAAHKFLTHISPSKSIEGLVGGLIACTIVVALMLAGLGQPPIGAIVLGPLLGLVAQAGDLAESMLKRAAGAKDSGP